MEQTFDPERRTVTCPHAKKVNGVIPGRSGVICGVMEADQARADSILEGAPVGVFISAGDDPSTWATLCTGQGDPVVDPDHLREREFGMGHYSGCPIFLASLQIAALERAFAPKDRPATVAGATAPMVVDPGDIESMGG